MKELEVKWKTSRNVILTHEQVLCNFFIVLALFQASVAKQMKSALFWDLTHDAV